MRSAARAAAAEIIQYNYSGSLESFLSSLYLSDRTVLKPERSLKVTADMFLLLQRV